MIISIDIQHVTVVCVPMTSPRLTVSHRNFSFLLPHHSRVSVLLEFYTFYKTLKYFTN